ncbi:MAG: DUF72 domain-containing protein [Bacteroidetes bacterium QH_7_62_13]|nr:MAG: DUF72 domain-containing protein [Bacteroidetes bacterium QH_7_62_13]
MQRLFVAVRTGLSEYRSYSRQRGNRWSIPTPPGRKTLQPFCLSPGTERSGVPNRKTVSDSPRSHSAPHAPLMPSLHIGTSGWQHDPFAGRFYPDDLAQGDRLAFYANTFGTVEVNNTFYQSPDEDTLRAWRRQTPDAFTFAIKANQYITHFKKLKDPVEPVQNLYRNVAPLGDKLGPLLFQCPPNWHQNLDRLHSFLETLDDTHRHVFEFRDPTWLNEGTTRALAAHDAAFCVYDYGDRETLRTVTTDWVYVRLHGAGEAYRGRYSDAALEGWARQIRDWMDEGRDVYFYFNNTAGEGHAPHDAQRLRKRLATG